MTIRNPILVAGTSLLLSACMSAPPRWEPTQLVSRTEAAPMELVLRGGDRLDEDERRALQQFRDGYRATPGDRLLLTHSPARRMAAIDAAEWLAQRGLSVSLTTDPLLPADSLHLGLWHSEIVLPECGNWQGATQPDYQNQPWPGFGCSVTRNLGLMIADPADLSLPNRLGPGDAELAAKAITRYRNAHDEAASSTSPISINLGGSEATQ
ncbi:MAG: hypothetical protein H6981_01995 [Gammaproteobacteria bacterium]|nr:hypothetical protein [Gammaproteobacteria bacterium]MCP5135561.1 hypothetical protein [Gammaproteobacteria bacterium]